MTSKVYNDSNVLVWQGTESRLIRTKGGSWIVEVKWHDSLGEPFWQEIENINDIPDEMMYRIAGDRLL